MILKQKLKKSSIFFTKNKRTIINKFWILKTSNEPIKCHGIGVIGETWRGKKII